MICLVSGSRTFCHQQSSTMAAIRATYALALLAWCCTSLVSVSGFLLPQWRSRGTVRHTTVVRCKNAMAMRWRRRSCTLLRAAEDADEDGEGAWEDWEEDEAEAEAEEDGDIISRCLDEDLRKRLTNMEEKVPTSELELEQQSAIKYIATRLNLEVRVL